MCFSSHEMRKSPASRRLAARMGCGLGFLPSSLRVKKGFGRPMRSSLPESRRVDGDSESKRANLMLEEPPLTVRTRLPAALAGLPPRALFLPDCFPIPEIAGSFRDRPPRLRYSSVELSVVAHVRQILPAGRRTIMKARWKPT